MAVMMNSRCIVDDLKQSKADDMAFILIKYQQGLMD